MGATPVHDSVGKNLKTEAVDESQFVSQNEMAQECKLLSGKPKLICLDYQCLQMFVNKYDILV